MFKCPRKIQINDRPKDFHTCFRKMDSTRVSLPWSAQMFPNTLYLWNENPTGFRLLWSAQSRHQISLEQGPCKFIFQPFVVSTGPLSNISNTSKHKLYFIFMLTFCACCIDWKMSSLTQRVLCGMHDRFQAYLTRFQTGIFWLITETT